MTLKKIKKIFGLSKIDLFHAVMIGAGLYIIQTIGLNFFLPLTGNADVSQFICLLLACLLGGIIGRFMEDKDNG